MKPLLHLLRLQNMPILEQLRIEEALLRADDRNWCLLNDGSPPAIVMGISGRPELLINPSAMEAQPLPVIRRFSGGGTVVVDHDTYFATFICHADILGAPVFPKNIGCWSKAFYQQVFTQSEFDLIENDYVFGKRKFGGNAQYIRKGRWLHHTTLLWDYQPHHMDYLLMPPKVPLYREKRSHADFLCSLRDYVPSKQILEDKLQTTLHDRFQVTEMTVEEIEEVRKRPHRRATTVIKTAKQG